MHYNTFPWWRTYHHIRITGIMQLYSSSLWVWNNLKGDVSCLMSLASTRSSVGLFLKLSGSVFCVSFLFYFDSLISVFTPCSPLITRPCPCVFHLCLVIPSLLWVYLQCSPVCQCQIVLSHRAASQRFVKEYSLWLIVFVPSVLSLAFRFCTSACSDWLLGFWPLDPLENLMKGLLSL